MEFLIDSGFRVNTTLVIVYLCVNTQQVFGLRRNVRCIDIKPTDSPPDPETYRNTKDLSEKKKKKNILNEIRISYNLRIFRKLDLL